MNKKIQVIFNSSYPIGNVSTHRVHHICKGLVENGVDVDVLIVHPTEQQDKYLNVNSSGSYEGVKYRYIANSIFRKKNIFIRKLIDLYCHILVVFSVMFNINKKDVFIVIGPSLDFRTFLPIVVFFQKATIFLEINEYPLLRNSESILSRIKRFIFFKSVVPLYDGFIVISTELDNLLNKYKSKKSKNIKIPILGDFVIDKNELTHPLDSKYIIHSGSLFEEKDGFMAILEAYHTVLSKIDIPLKFVITGNVKNDSINRHIFEYINNNHLEENIVFTGFLSDKELEEYMRGASLAIINKYDNLQNRYCFSTKLADYLKNEVPIIATSVGEMQHYLVDGVNAYVIEDNNKEILIDKIIEAIHESEKSKLQAKEGLSLVKKDFNYKYQGSVLKDFLNSYGSN